MTNILKLRNIIFLVNFGFIAKIDAQQSRFNDKSDIIISILDSFIVRNNIQNEFVEVLVDLEYNQINYMSGWINSITYNESKYIDTITINNISLQYKNSKVKFFFVNIQSDSIINYTLGLENKLDSFVKYKISIGEPLFYGWGYFDYLNNLDILSGASNVFKFHKVEFLIIPTIQIKDRVNKIFIYKYNIESKKLELYYH